MDGEPQPRPVSWMVIERGWTVVDAAGDGVGQVEEVLGDLEADIFNGLNVLPGVLGRQLYVPAECVDAIVEGNVRLKVSKDELEEAER